MYYLQRLVLDKNGYIEDGIGSGAVEGCIDGRLSQFNMQEQAFNALYSDLRFYYGAQVRKGSYSKYVNITGVLINPERETDFYNRQIAKKKNRQVSSYDALQEAIVNQVLRARALEEKGTGEYISGQIANSIQNMYKELPVFDTVLARDILTTNELILKQRLYTRHFLVMTQ